MSDEEDDKIQAEQTYDIEDEVQDWKFLQATASTSSKSTSSAIPKRGEKEFEPDGTTVQTSALDESQRAMFGALSNLRGHHVKNKLLGVWITGGRDGDSGYCLITAVRGNYFRDLGKAMSIGGVNAMTLNSLETTYLAERGSLIVYLANDEYLDWIHGDKDKEKEFDVETRLVALDLECLYCLLDVPLAKYQVYAYLKRLGYVLQDHTPPPPPSPSPAQPEHERTKSTGLFSMWPRQWGILAYPIHHTLHFQTRHYFNYTEVYKSIRLNTSPIPPPPPPPTGTPSSDLHITFNVWKPMQNFSKKSPPPPDFQLCVVDASKSTQFLTLPQIQRLHTELTPKTSKVVPKLTSKKESRKMESKREIRAKKYAERQASLDVSVQLRNEYLRTRDELFKNGVDPVVIAVTNNGILNFLTLSRGQFNEVQYNERLGEIYPDRLHSIIYTN